MSYTSDEINKAKELFRKTCGNYPTTAQELTEALELLDQPLKPLFKITYPFPNMCLTQ